MHCSSTSSLSCAIRCPFNTVSEVSVHNLLAQVKNGPLTQLFYSYDIHELWVLLTLDVVRYYVPWWNTALQPLLLLKGGGGKVNHCTPKISKNKLWATTFPACFLAVPKGSVQRCSKTTLYYWISLCNIVHRSLINVQLTLLTNVSFLKKNNNNIKLNMFGNTSIVFIGLFLNALYFINTLTGLPR